MNSFLLKGLLLKRTNRWCKVLTYDALDRRRVVQLPRVKLVEYPTKQQVGGQVRLTIPHELAYINKLLQHEELEGG